MAAITPNKIEKENAGSLTLLICTFNPTGINSLDTYATGIKGIKSAVFQSNDATVFDANIGINWNSSGTITFTTLDDGQTGQVLIWCKG